MEKKIWIDIINPSHPLFFQPLITELQKINTINITLRNRGETVNLAKQFGLCGRIYGNFYEKPIKKIFTMITRTIYMNYTIKPFDYAISFENPMSVTVSKLRRKKSILLLDNDLKYKIKNTFTQDFESKIKILANTIIIPHACEKTFYKYNKNDKFKVYDGYKEDFYIADYKPDEKILKILPFDEYIVVRGEASASFYVNTKKTILPQLFDLFTKENINILFLPRDKSDTNYKDTGNIKILKKPLNGLDLIYYSKGTLTGSGTMAREAACLGITAVSFFPNNELLSVDAELENKGKILHSRDPKEIVEYVLLNYGKKRKLDFERCKSTKEEVLKIINSCIE